LFDDDDGADAGTDDDDDTIVVTVRAHIATAMFTLSVMLHISSAGY